MPTCHTQADDAQPGDPPFLFVTLLAARKAGDRMLESLARDWLAEAGIRVVFDDRPDAPPHEGRGHVADELLNGEPLTTLSRAAARFPGHRGADRLHPSTLTRWILTGARAADGRRVKLEAVLVGGRWLTSEPDLARLAVALGLPEQLPGLVRTPAARRRAGEAAGRVLRDMGA